MDERRWFPVFIASALVAVTLAGARDVNAQVANAESLVTEKPGFSFSLAGAFTLRRGNVDQTVVGGSTHAQVLSLYEDLDPKDDVPPFVRQRGFVNGNVTYTSQDDTTFLSQGFAHARWTAMWFPRAGTEVFTQYQYHESQRLQARVLGGAGVRVVLVHRKNAGVEAGTGAMLEYERLASLPGSTAHPETLAPRSTSFLTAEVRVWDVLTLKNTIYVQPRLDDFRDIRVLEGAALDVAVTKVLSLGTGLTVAYDSRPPVNVEPYDLTLVQTVKLTF